jgi:hypothetical protein
MRIPRTFDSTGAAPAFGPAWTIPGAPWICSRRGRARSELNSRPKPNDGSHPSCIQPILGTSLFWARCASGGRAAVGGSFWDRLGGRSRQPSTHARLGRPHARLASAAGSCAGVSHESNTKQAHVTLRKIHTQNIQTHTGSSIRCSPPIPSSKSTWPVQAMLPSAPHSPRTPPFIFRIASAGLAQSKLPPLPIKPCFLYFRLAGVRHLEPTTTRRFHSVLHSRSPRGA